MSESKSALLAKSVQKHAGRAKEKLLQNLGKVDRTLDDIFEEHLTNFNRQHQQAMRLQKEFNNYIRCVRAMQTASKSLMEAIAEVYESGWSGHDLQYVQAQNLDMLWQDYSHKLGDQVLIPLNTYTNQFPEVRKKIEKRGRKLVDYDSQRHSFQSLQASAAKRRDDVKVTKGREQLEEAKRTYELLNSELHDELPALYDSRVLFYVNNLQTLFTAEQLFHSESSKVFAELEAITDKLANECQRGSYTKKMANSLVNSISNNIGNNGLSPPKGGTLTPHNGNASPNTNSLQTPPSPALNGDSPRIYPDLEHDDSKKATDDSKDDEDKIEEIADQPITPAETPEGPEPVVKKRTLDREKDGTKESSGTDKQTDGDAKKDMNEIPAGATLSNLPAGVLYRVRATYKYTREDDDELSFDVGDVINVVEYDDPEEQEEGWLMGIKTSTNEKGMFPANFTRPI